MAVKVKPVPEYKLDGAYDAGRAWLVDHHGARGVPRERVRRDEDGMPELDDESGTPMTERVRRSAGSQKWVTSTGTVAVIRMSDGSGVPLGVSAAREAKVRERLHNRQAIRYGTCPVRDPLSMQWIPKAMRNQKPCDPGTHGEQQCCKHVQEIIDKRTAMQSSRTAKANAKMMSDQQKQSQDMQALLGHVLGRKSETVK